MQGLFQYVSYSSVNFTCTCKNIPKIIPALSTWLKSLSIFVYIYEPSILVYPSFVSCFSIIMLLFFFLPSYDYRINNSAGSFFLLLWLVFILLALSPYHYVTCRDNYLSFFLTFLPRPIYCISTEFSASLSSLGNVTGLWEVNDLYCWFLNCVDTWEPLL